MWRKPIIKNIWRGGDLRLLQQVSQTCLTRLAVPSSGKAGQRNECSRLWALLHYTHGSKRLRCACVRACARACETCLTPPAWLEVTGENAALVQRGNIPSQFTANLNLMGHSLRQRCGFWCRRALGTETPTHRIALWELQNGGVTGGHGIKGQALKQRDMLSEKCGAIFWKAGL